MKLQFNIRGASQLKVAQPAADAAHPDGESLCSSN